MPKRPLSLRIKDIFAVSFEVFACDRARVFCRGFLNGTRHIMVVTEVAMDNYSMRGGWQGKDAENELRRRAAEYSSMSRGALESELAREAARLRAEGMLDIGQLTAFMNAAAPYMSAEQLKRMRELIDSLR